MRKGDRAFFYHSNIGKEIVGVVEVVREAYPDPSATRRWVCVDMKAVRPLQTPVTLAAAKADPALADMALVRYSRLSVGPVSRRSGRISASWGGYQGLRPRRCSMHAKQKQFRGSAVSETTLFHVKPSVAASAHVNGERYRLMVNHAARDPDHFWAEQARRIAWMREPTTIRTPLRRRRRDQVVRGRQAQRVRRLPGRASRRARRPGRDHLGRRRPGQSRSVTYRELHEQVCRLANVLKARGVGAATA